MVIEQTPGGPKEISAGDLPPETSLPDTEAFLSCSPEVNLSNPPEYTHNTNPGHRD